MLSNVNASSLNFSHANSSRELIDKMSYAELWGLFKPNPKMAELILSLSAVVNPPVGNEGKVNACNSTAPEQDIKSFVALRKNINESIKDKEEILERNGMKNVEYCVRLLTLAECKNENKVKINWVKQCLDEYYQLKNKKRCDPFIQRARRVSL